MKYTHVEMYGTVSQDKHKLVADLGAIPIDYTTEDFVKRIFTLTGDGVDAVFDPIGDTHLNQSFQTLRRKILTCRNSAKASNGTWIKGRLEARKSGK